MKHANLRFRRVAVAFLLLAAPVVVMAAIRQNGRPDSDQPPPVANPDPGPEDPHVQELIRRALRQPIGLREPGDPVLRRPGVAVPER